MNDLIPDRSADNGGHFLANLLHFGRLLRQLNIPISSQQIYGLAEGLVQIDLYSREDFYSSSRAFLLHDVTKLKQFDLAFDLFWSKHIKMIFQFSAGQKSVIRRAADMKDSESTAERLDTRLLDEYDSSLDDHNLLTPSEIEINPVYSPHEILYRKDFKDLNEEEFLQAKSVIREMVWRLDRKLTRRKANAIKQSKFLDFRRSLRNNLKHGGELVQIKWRRRKLKTRPLIVLCDISGSMQRYSQLFLYFLYALVQETRRIETFVFGTRLTRLTPLFKKKNTDQVLDELSNHIMDWSGGTRIGESIREFNFYWSRRVSTHGSVVIIISDGWDRGNYDMLDQEVSRLSRSANRLIWLNPLAGSPEYQPLVRGIQTVLPYLDDFYPINNLYSLESLAMKLGEIE